MPLSASSVLHYWSSRYGINPRVGGRPVFSRSTGATFATQEGEVDTGIVNTPRFDWMTVKLPNSLTERRKLLTLELASTNIVASELSAWTLTTTTRTASQPDPRGASNAYLLNATGAAGEAALSVSFTGNGTKGTSLRVRQGTGAETRFGIHNGTVWRGLVALTWSAAGVPVLTAAAGALSYTQATQLGNGWWDIRIGVQGVVAADPNAFYIFPAGNATGTATVYRPQAEDGVFATAMIDAVSTTRATDSCYWNFPPVPQAMMIYSRHVEQGSILQTDTARIFSIASAAEASPRLLVYNAVAGYVAYHNNNPTVVQSALAAAPVVGDTVELLTILFADGSVQLIQSINGAAVSSAAQSAANAMAASWSDTRLYLNAGATGAGSNKFAEIKIVKYADVVGVTAATRMTELQGFELGPNGDAL